MLFAIVVAVWFPVGSYWQSDDFLAITYAQDWRRGLSDFHGAQYGVDTLVTFLRPLITMSFVADAWAGEHAPFVSHLNNAVAHGISTVCLALIAYRFVPGRIAWPAALVWGVAPCHASSVFWAVGRVDSHTTMWLALSTLTLVQWGFRQRRTRLFSLVFFVFALGSKELAGVMPGVALVLCYAMSEPGWRLRDALRGSWPYFVVLGLYLGWRYLALGRVVGGYEGSVETMPALTGLGVRTLELLNPAWHEGHDTIELPSAVWLLGFVPAGVGALALLAGRSRRVFVGCVVLFLGCAVPSVQVWNDTGNPMILRQFTLPMMALAVVLAGWGWRSAIPVLVVFALPMWELRQDYQDSWQRMRSWHERIQEQVPQSDYRLNFVTGLPRAHPNNTTIEFHLFVDRLLLPPFRASDRVVMALRPMNQTPNAFKIPYGEDVEVPIGATWIGTNESLRGIRTEPRSKSMGIYWEGPPQLDLAALDRIVQNFLDPANARPEAEAWIRTAGVRAKSYRITIFTAGGYLTMFAPDRAAPGDKDGRIHVGSLLTSPLDSDGLQRCGDQLQIATALDRDKRFSVLVEADTRPEASGAPADFQPTHVSLAPVWLEVDPRFADWWQ